MYTFNTNTRASTSTTIITPTFLNVLSDAIYLKRNDKDHFHNLVMMQLPTERTMYMIKAKRNGVSLMATTLPEVRSSNQTKLSWREISIPTNVEGEVISYLKNSLEQFLQTFGSELINNLKGITTQDIIFKKDSLVDIARLLNVKIKPKYASDYFYLLTSDNDFGPRQLAVLATMKLEVAISSLASNLRNVTKTRIRYDNGAASYVEPRENASYVLPMPRAFVKATPYADEILSIELYAGTYQSSPDDSRLKTQNELFTDELGTLSQISPSADTFKIAINGYSINSHDYLDDNNNNNVTSPRVSDFNSKQIFASKPIVPEIRKKPIATKIYVHDQDAASLGRQRSYEMYENNVKVTAEMIRAIKDEMDSASELSDLNLFYALVVRLLKVSEVELSGKTYGEIIDVVRNHLVDG